MNKSTNNFRKCPYCPHHSKPKPKNCCCKSRKNSVQTKRESSRTIKNQSLQYINQTIPIPTINFESNKCKEKEGILNISNYPSILLSAANHRKSTLKQQQENLFTMPSFTSNQTYILHEKLYQSNQSLQEAIMKMDIISKSNQQLYQQNNELKSLSDKLSLQKELLKDQLIKCKKKIKKNKTIDEHLQNQQIQTIMKINIDLKQENITLMEQNRCLMNEINTQKANIADLSKIIQKNIPEERNLSPDWIAHTSHKILKIQQNIAKIQNNCEIQDHIIEEEQDGLTYLKSVLCGTIKFMTSKIRKVQSDVNVMKEVKYLQWQTLVKGLLECICECVMGIQQKLQNQIMRKMANYQKKINNLYKKLENLLIVVKNEKLKAKSIQKTRKTAQDSLRCSLSSISHNHC